MTTPIVPSISDEQLAELEEFCATPMFKDDADSPQTMGELRGLIARLRAAEADAKRYRFLRSESTSPGFLCNNDRAAQFMNEYMACGDKMDALIDAEMERTS